MHNPGDADRLKAPALPWATPPSDRGVARCTWCGRHIYQPAVPCSVEPLPNLLDLETHPGFGDRCKWEFQTRRGSDTSHTDLPRGG